MKEEMDDCGRQEHLFKAMFKEGMLPRVDNKCDSVVSATFRRVHRTPPNPWRTDREYLERLGFEENEITKPLFDFADEVKTTDAWNIKKITCLFLLALGKSKTTSSMDNLTNDTHGDNYEIVSHPDNFPPSPTKTADLSEGEFDMVKMVRIRHEADLFKALFKEGKIPRKPKWDSSMDATLTALFEHTPKPSGMTCREFLESLHLEENEITKPLFDFADRMKKPLFGIDEFAKNFILELGTPKSANPLHYGGENSIHYAFNAGQNDRGMNVDVEIRGFSFPSSGTNPQAKQITDIMEYLGIKSGQRSDNKLFHGTSSKYAYPLLEIGVLDSCLSSNADFGRAFYCSHDIREAYKCAREKAGDCGDLFGVIIYFDLPENYAEGLNKLEVFDRSEGSVRRWEEVVKAVRKDSHDLEAPGSTWFLRRGYLIETRDLINGFQRNAEGRPAIDGPKQYAFRTKKAWNKIFEDMTKIKIVVFEVEPNRPMETD